VLAWAAEHLAQRMGHSSWLIATPQGVASWDGSTLRLQRNRGQGDGCVSEQDEAETLWLAYFRSTFNPARLNETALQQHMPVRYWKGLPEGALISAMVSEARSGARRVAQASGVSALGGKSIPIEAEFAQPVRAAPSSLDACRRCGLWQHATQPVGGAGPRHARIMLLGEQPGDQEDLCGKPFVGPAGQLLDITIARADLRRDAIYLTNAVKHFKWTPRGKRRLHQTPAQREVEACSFWLDEELQGVRPAVIVALGATALGAKVSLQDYLDAPFHLDGMRVTATYHPSFALRQENDEGRARVLDAISAALARARKMADLLLSRDRADD
jgi:uracil-DNA glycosylase family protein